MAHGDASEPTGNPARSAGAIAAFAGVVALGVAAYFVLGTSGTKNDADADRPAIAPTTAAARPAASSASGVTLADPADFAALRGPGTVLLNVHIPYEGDIEGTTLSIPFDQIAARAAELPADLDTPLLVYCRSGRMSAIAGEELVRLGYRNITDLRGGMIAWEASGRPLIRSNP